MRLTPEQLITELCLTLDPSNARAAVDSYVDLQQRFLAGDWKPAELDGGRLCEAVARCLLQVDQGLVTHHLLPGKVGDALRDKSKQHSLGQQDRDHILKAIEMVYKFRSDRGAVHISPIYSANYMDSMLVVHASKWLLAEFLRIAWRQDRTVLADVISHLVQLQHSIIHEQDGKPLVLSKDISAPDEVLVLLFWAQGNRLTRSQLLSYATQQRPGTMRTAISRLITEKDVRVLDSGEIGLTPKGQKRLMEQVLPRRAT